ncbi:hypothetical protein BKA62DRAFT_754732 [Auriculariales sp. MPI-PUGE-AT-0066]|nr:hypothetical protein BKA62DRAFT_754732 [Auriculariales sp. MPI-PUGE-AT-0066]
MTTGQPSPSGLADAIRELDIGVEGGQQHSLDPGKLVYFNRWTIAIAVVDFDIDTGPCIKELYPPVSLDSGLAQNIAFSAFPDASATEAFSEVHSFRIRYVSGSVPEHAGSQDGFLNGFSHFTQRRDQQIRRGYFQRAVVMLTHHAFPSLFTSLVCRLAPMYFEHGTAMLETACHNIANWPAPALGVTVELGFLGAVYTVALPKDRDGPQFVETAFGSNFDASHQLLASLPLLLASSRTVSATPQPGALLPHGTETLLALSRSILPSLWSMWECLVLCEPLLVYGPSPAVTSGFIWWLRDLIRPLPSTLDFRPYFTVHDADFKALVPRAKSKGGVPPAPKSGLVLGVTNPYIETACSHWPHIVSLGQPLEYSKNSETQSLARSASMGGGKRGSLSIFGDINYTKSKSQSILSAPLKNVSSPSLVQSQQSGPAPGWHTKTHARYINRTTAVLQPLNRYLTTLISPGGEQLGRFNDAQFFASLAAHGAALPFRSNAKRRAFYERFLKAPVFGAWLAEAEARVLGHQAATLRLTLRITSRMSSERLCDQCNGAACKYTCPRCSSKTCSLACSRQHKEATGCSGERNKASYVSINQYGWGTLMDDYSFLEDVGGKQKTGVGKSLGAGSSLRVAGTVALALEGGGEQASWPQLTSQTRRVQINDADISKLCLPQQLATLTVEFVLHPPRNTLELATNPPDPITILSHKNNWSLPLSDLSQRSVPTKQKASYPEWVSELVSGQSNGQTVLLLKVVGREDACETPGFVKLEPSKSLQAAVQGQCFVEFPTVHLWDLDVFTENARGQGPATHPLAQDTPTVSTSRPPVKAALSSKMQMLLGGYTSDSGSAISDTVDSDGEEG